MSDTIMTDIAAGIAAGLKADRYQQRREAWSAHVKFVDPHENRLRRRHIELFNKQRDEVLKNMDRHPVTFGIKTPVASTLDAWLFGRNLWNRIMANETRNIISGIVVMNGSRILGSMPGVAAAFDVENPRVVGFVQEKPSTWSRIINETTETDLRATLTEGMVAGETMTALKNRVQTYYGAIANNVRAMRIARTEANGAANFGTMEAYRQTEGVVIGKEWAATLDARVRDSHAMMDGERIALEERFSNGLEYPGDPAGDPSETVNCRCTTLAITDDEEI